MASLPIYKQDGSEAGSYEISAEDIAPTINRQLLHDAVVMYQANLRQGTHRTRNRSEVAGSTRKMYRQKGTGNARAGHRKSGVRVGGGHIHARRPRDYSYRLPRKALQSATRMAVASKVADGQLTVLDALQLDAPRTKDIAAMIKAIGLEGVTALLVTDQHDVNVYKSVRNIQGLSVLPVTDLNALAVLRPTQLVATKAALEQLKSGKPAAAADA